MIVQIDIHNGDIETIYRFENHKVTDDKSFKSFERNKKNDFNELYELTNDCFMKGHRGKNFWGVKYEKAKSNLLNFVKNYLHVSEITRKSNITEPNELFACLVNFHLLKKNIKGHDEVYVHIKNDYPKLKWLKKNNQKFLPAVLDGYGIKSNYLISEINQHHGLNIMAINYLCKLFGENYVDYFKNFDWKKFCYTKMPNKKLHSLKNEHEKKQLLQLLNNIENIKTEPALHLLNNLFETRKYLEKYDLDLKYKAKNRAELDDLTQFWMSKKIYYSKGEIQKYFFPDYFIEEIEQDILIDNKRYEVKILKSEDEFIVEGQLMKNCMSKKFVSAGIFVYLTMRLDGKRINLQYKNGKYDESYGKTNTPTPIIFQDAIDILNKRFAKYSDLEWYRGTNKLSSNKF